MPLRLLLLVLTLLLPAGAGSALAQDPPMKWGKIPQEHLAMTAFPADTNATAVILADYGTVTFNDDYSLIFERHRRIKILSEAGFDHGTVTIPYYIVDRAERVRSVKAQTFYLDESGKVVRQELKKKDIFEEKVDDRYRRIRFTLPALQPGSVIEYRYTLDAANPYLMPSWQFQWSEPTLWSEFRPEFPTTLQFVRATRGMPMPLFIEESIETVRQRGDALIHRMVMKDVPALREEPYMTTPNDYRASVELQLSGYVAPGHGLTKVLHTWDKLASELRDLPNFRQFMNPPKGVRDRAQELVEGLDAPEDKVRAIYDFVRTSITYSGLMGFIPDQQIDAVLKTKKGSSPDIAILLAAMLREAGLDAAPVLVSTRTHGSVIEAYPLLSQFNDVIVLVSHGASTYLLDATDPLRPVELLPFEVLNTRGWMVGAKESRWIDVKASSSYEENIYIDAALLAGGDLKAHVQRAHRGYSALEERSALQESGEKDYVAKYVLEGKDVSEVSVFTFGGADAADEVFKLSGEVVFPSYAQSAGDLLYLNLKPFGRIDKNPFRLPERTFPVDFGYPATRSYTVKLAVPDGYVVQELPKQALLRIASESALYHRTVQQDSAHVVLQIRFELKKAVYSPKEYQELRALYDRIVGLESEHVVLKRAGVGEPAKLSDGAGGS